MAKQYNSTEKLLEKLVSIPSVFPKEQEISNFLVDYLKEIGFSVKKVSSGKGRNSIVGTFGRSKKYLGFYGHMDTVPRADYSHAFEVQKKGNKVTGLGVEDMKGGIAAILQTAVYAKEHNYPLKVVFGVDEEDISQGAHDLVDSRLLDDIAFMMVGESGQIQNMNQPFNVCYGRNGRILLEAIVSGKKAHAAESEKGVNAIEHAAQLVTFLQSVKLPLHKNLGKTRIVVHTIEGASDSFSLPELCRITFSLLTTPAVSSKEILKKVVKFCKKSKISVKIQPVIRKTPYGESFEIDLKNPFLKILEKEIFIPNKIKPIYTPSVADENIFANKLKIPVVSMGPIGGGGHTEDEWLDVTSLATVEKNYKKIVELYYSSK